MKFVKPNSFQELIDYIEIGALYKFNLISSSYEKTHTRIVLFKQKYSGENFFYCKVFCLTQKKILEEAVFSTSNCEFLRILK